MKNVGFILILCSLFFQSCIGDDVIFDTVEPEIRIMNPVDTIEINTNYQFKFSYFNNIGQQVEDIDPVWKSSNPDIISIESDGNASAQNEGSSIVSVEYFDSEKLISDSIEVAVGKSTVVVNTGRSGIIQTTSSYRLEGDFTIEDNGSGGVRINFADNFFASSALPGLYVYLTNNPNSVAGALTIKKVDVFQGAHSIDVNDVDINDYNHLLYFCKPFNVKVGDAEIN